MQHEAQSPELRYLEQSMSVQTSPEPAQPTPQPTISQAVQQQQGQTKKGEQQSAGTQPAVKPQIRDWASI